MPLEITLPDVVIKIDGLLQYSGFVLMTGLL